MNAMLSWPKSVLAKIAAHSTIQHFGSWLQGFYGSRSKKEAGMKVVLSGIFFPIFNYLMWLLTGLTFLLVIFLKSHGLSFWIIFLILWLGNILLCRLIILLYDKTGVDFTLSETYRKSTDRGGQKSRIVGIFLEIWFFVTLIFWAGASQFHIFYREKLGSNSAKISVFLLVSAAQMILWTYAFFLGYDSVVDLIFK